LDKVYKWYLKNKNDFIATNVNKAQTCKKPSKKEAISFKNEATNLNEISCLTKELDACRDFKIHKPSERGMSPVYFPILRSTQLTNEAPAFGKVLAKSPTRKKSLDNKAIERPQSAKKRSSIKLVFLL
jgi:hypothetical protein